MTNKYTQTMLTSWNMVYRVENNINSTELVNKCTAKIMNLKS